MAKVSMNVVPRTTLVADLAQFAGPSQRMRAPQRAQIVFRGALRIKGQHENSEDLDATIASPPDTAAVVCWSLVVWRRGSCTSACHAEGQRRSKMPKTRHKTVEENAERC